MLLFILRRLYLMKKTKLLSCICIFIVLCMLSPLVLTSCDSGEGFQDAKNRKAVALTILTVVEDSTTPEALAAVEKGDAQIGLVPDLKKPAPHLFRAVTRLQEAHEGLYVALPGVVILGRVHIGFVEKKPFAVAFRQSLWHKAQFHKGFHASGQHIVVDHAALAEAGLHIVLPAGQQWQNIRHRVHEPIAICW